MQMLVFGNRQDETEIFETCNQKYGYHLAYTPEMLTTDNCKAAQGFDAVCIVVGCKITKEVAEKLHNCGVRYIITRAAGTDHLDMNAINRLRMHAANVPAYSPNSISEHTVMLILASLRKLRTQLRRVDARDFEINGLRGRELKEMTAGIIGTGRIGAATIENLSGFGCKILACDQYENERVKALAEYVPLQRLLSESDIIVLHCPLNKENYRLINEKTLAVIKTGAYLVNTARGGLVNANAVLAGLKSGAIGNYAFDVYEFENNFCRKNFSGEPLQDAVMEELLLMNNVIYTTHTAFYTDEAISNMIGCSFENLYEYETTGSCINEVIS